MRRWLALVPLAGCVQDPTPLDDARCPCLDGYVCCDATRRCVPEGADACPAPEAPALRLDAVAPSEGPVAGGTTVTLTGAGLGDAIAVRFGGRPATGLVVEGDGRLTCVTPPGAGDWGPVDVVVETAGGAAALSEGFRYALAPFIDRTAGSGLGAGLGTGLALWDADGDALPELALARFASWQSFFLRNEGGLRFADATGEPWLQSLLPLTSAVVPGDFTGDGLVDLAIVGSTSNAIGAPLLALAEGAPGGAPLPVAATDVARRGTEWLSLDAFDFDADGDLDLAGCRQMDPPAAAADLAVVLRNEGGRFTLAPDAGGVDPGRVGEGAGCFNARAADFDGDGATDLALCGTTLSLLRNEGGRFVDRTTALGLPTALPAVCQSLAWADADADGDLDLALFPYGAPADREGAPAGVTIYRYGDGRFTRWEDADLGDAPCAAGRAPDASLPGGFVGGAFFDADHDGDEDLFLPYPFTACPTAPALYESAAAGGEPGFRARVLPQADQVVGQTGVAAGDLDGDGDLDVVAHVWNFGSPNRLFRNNLAENAGTSAGPRGGWLRVRAVTDPDGDTDDGDASDERDAPGVRVDLDLDGPADAPDFAPGPGRLATRTIGPAGSMAHGALPAHFGLGDRPGPFWARARFPDGSVAVARASEAETTLVLRDCGRPRCP
jgi:hypothetical protein